MSSEEKATADQTEETSSQQSGDSQEETDSQKSVTKPEGSDVNGAAWPDREMESFRVKLVGPGPHDVIEEEVRDLACLIILSFPLIMLAWHETRGDTGARGLSAVCGVVVEVACSCGCYNISLSSKIPKRFSFESRRFLFFYYFFYFFIFHWCYCPVSVMSS